MRPNVICTFGFVSSIFFTCIQYRFFRHFENKNSILYHTTENCAGSVHQKKDSTDASIYLPLFMEIQDKHHDYIPVYADGSWDGISVACATVFLPDTVISM